MARYLLPDILFEIAVIKIELEKVFSEGLQHSLDDIEFQTN